MTNVIQFSDHFQKKVEAELQASLETGVDELGKTIVAVELGPLEVHVYTSQDDGSLIVQIDHATLTESEKPSLRVYLNDTTLYDPEIESGTDSTPEGA